ncbi:hypothetical protein Lalb_Chr09g0326361 [Lupinus albus]|uniref:Uncharacterized protein n=1 Tax=Lupinus albus TaxID=3870 RepID=A0A6A4PZU8_LUPAL|nr:hypothetical protein Lalb_Chr09g0326361 [Lupinus albus]
MILWLSLEFKMITKTIRIMNKKKRKRKRKKKSLPSCSLVLTVLRSPPMMYSKTARFGRCSLSSIKIFSSLTLPTTADSYCEWTPKSAVKSNSTGFSKLWRFKEHMLRSNSDGKDTFVLIQPAAAKAEKARSGEVRNVVVKKVKGKTTSSSAHEKNYVMYRAKKENEKHKSYLPYKQDLFGFFANANGFTRNVHPY